MDRYVKKIERIEVVNVDYDIVEMNCSIFSYFKIFSNEFSV
jgi:hypothetical protein